MNNAPDPLTQDIETFLSTFTKPMNTLSEAEISFIFCSPECLRELAHYWSVQETMSDAFGDDTTNCTKYAEEKRKQYELLADQAQIAVDNGD